MTGNKRRTRATRGVGLATILGLALLAGSAWAGTIDKAKAAAKEKDWATAADAYAKALDEGGSTRAAAIGLAEAAVKAGRTDLFATAEDALLGLRDKNDADADVLVALGEISLAQSSIKQDTLAKKSLDFQAKQSFEAALKLRPQLDAAAAGLAQTFYQSGDFEGAIQTVDAFLARKPAAPGRALYWKGQALYLQARDAFTAAGSQLTDDVRGRFVAARDAYQASVKADPSDYDACIQLAYAAAYLQEEDAARQAYRQAAVLAPRQAAPFEGLKTLLAYRADAFRAEIEGILKDQPKHEMALWYGAFDHYGAKDWRGAMKLLQQYVKVGQFPAQGWHWIGICAAAAGEANTALNAWYEALDSQPNHEQATAEIEKRIRAGGAEQRALGSVKGALAVIAEYKPLLKGTPGLAWVRNNLAFMLREAYVKNNADKAWEPILKAATETYVDASDILGEWTAEKEGTYDWARRYAEAQIISDTGLMFQYYEPTRDYEKAEMYYRRALEYTEDGYRDAFDNLRKILTEKQRWQELHDLCAACAQNLTQENGEADTPTREFADQIRKKLLADGKAKEEE